MIDTEHHCSYLQFFHTVSSANLDPQAPRPPLAAIHGSNPTLLVKYSYKSNPDQPGGFPELTVKQGQKVTFLNAHEHEGLWWNVRDENNGQSGYIPGSYVMVCNRCLVTNAWGLFFIHSCMLYTVL